MSATPLGDGNKLFKGAIRQYFVKSLLQDLGKLHTLTTSTGMQACIQNETTEIQKEVEQMTNFLIAIDEWENKVFDSFSMIQRCISRKMGDDSKRKMVGNILAEIKELKKLAPNITNLKQVEETHDKPLKRATFEVGESSNSVKDTSSTKNDGSLEYVECIEKLNAQQKELLHSLTIFPENTEMKKKLLIDWWICLGLLPSGGETSATENQSINMDNQSIDIFRQLEQTNILKSKQVREHNKVVDSYTIDPTIHKQLISEFKKKNRIIESEETKGLHLYKNNNEVVVVLNLNKMHLSNYINIEPTIKVVQLGKWRYTNLEVNNKNMGTIHDVTGTKFLENMGEAVTYLSLRGISRIEELPQSIGKMRDLKILDLNDCHSLQKLPQKPKPKIWVGVSSYHGWFKELKHLDIKGCYLLYHMPKWVCELSNLQVLKGAVFNGFIPEGEEQAQLKDLSNLRKLIKLSIKIIHPHLLSPVDCTGLKHLSSLLILTIAWGRCGTSEQKTNVSLDQDVVHVTAKKSKKNSSSKMLGRAIKRVFKMKEKKQRKQGHGENEDGMTTPTIYFPENLEKLDIRCYPNAEAPELSNAAKLQKLKRLYIRGGKLAKFGDDVDWQVEILRLRFIKFLDLSWQELRTKFTKLEYVEYYECPRLNYFPKYKSSWSKEIDGPFSTHPDNFGPFNDDEPIPTEYSEPVALRLANSYIEEDRAVTSLELNTRANDIIISDLVMVLDIRKSMEGEKLAIMKAVMLSFIEDLTYFPCCRLSIVTFGIDTKGWPLCLTTESRRREIKILINSFAADGSTSASDGLQMGLKVLKDRQFSKARFSSLLLVSGSDNIDDAAQIPTGDVIIHTVGIGHDYDRKVLESIAAKSKGKFKHVRNTYDSCDVLYSLWLDWERYYWIDDLTLTFTPIRGTPILQQVDEADHNTVNFGSLYGNNVRKVRVILPHHSDEAEIRYSYKFTGVQFEAYRRLYREGHNVKLNSLRHLKL